MLLLKEGSSKYQSSLPETNSQCGYEYQGPSNWNLWEVLLSEPHRVAGVEGAGPGGLLKPKRVPWAVRISKSGTRVHHLVAESSGRSFPRLALFQ